MIQVLQMQKIISKVSKPKIKSLVITQHPSLRKNSINRVLDQITPSEIVKPDPNPEIKSEIDKLDVRLSNLSEKLDQNKTNPSTEIINNLEENASLER